MTFGLCVVRPLALHILSNASKEHRCASWLQGSRKYAREDFPWQPLLAATNMTATNPVGVLGDGLHHVEHSEDYSHTGHSLRQWHGHPSQIRCLTLHQPTDEG
jgi:hypothetical protein